MGMFLFIAPSVEAQDGTPTERKSKRAWEFGFGGSLYRLNRFNIINFQQDKLSGDYYLNSQKKDVLFGGNLYVARELNNYFALDLQSFIGFTRDKLRDGKDNRWVIKPEIGLQWRLGKYFNSKYIDPYFRVAVAYLYKNFNIVYNGSESFEGKDMLWDMNNLHNKQGADKRHMVGLPVGGGVNMWLNDKFGIGMQCNYIIKPYKNVANDIEGTVRVMWRWGGESKKPQPVVRYVDVERIVKEPIEVIKEVRTVEYVYDLFENIYFSFDSSNIEGTSDDALEKIAEIIKKNSDKRFLILGYTDAKGNSTYNLNLSERRAKAVVDALIDRGVSESSLKYRGMGKRIAMASENSENEVREGDRKVSIEIINNASYWDYLK